MNKRLKLIRQLGQTDCGAASLAMLMDYYGCKVDYPQFLTTLDIGRDGMSAAQIKAIAEENSFAVKIYKYNNLEDASQYAPFIICTQNNHYLVVETINDKYNKVTVLDPNGSREKVSIDILKKKSLNIAIVIEPKLSKYKTVKQKAFTGIKIKKKAVIGGIICTALLESLVFFATFLTKYIVDQMTVSQGINIVLFLEAILLISIMNFLFTIGRKRLIVLLQTDFTKELVEKVISKLMNLKLSFYHNHSSGDIVNRINSINTINNLITSSVFGIGVDLITGIVCIVIAGMLSAKLTLFIVGASIVELLLLLCINKSIRKQTKMLMAEQSTLQGIMYDGISNIELIRSAGLEKNITKKILSSFDTNINILKKRESANSVLEGILNTSSLLFPILLYILGSPFVLEKQMTLGKLVAMGSVLTFIIKPMISLAVYFPQFTMCAEIISRLREILLSEEKKKKGSAIIENVNTIEMDNVCFRYVANGNEVLHNVSLNAKNSQKIAIVGASGSGKTTITKLIMGLYDEYAGKIKINGKELSSICLESFQARSSIVTQVPLIVDGTIKENICWGATVDDEKIFDILKVCNLYEEVMKFPLNINTNVGEDGQNISGGQKQRIAIARALIKSPSILIFDEGTSNLDPVSERNIYQNIRKLGTIQIIVTHRYNTIIDADYIYLLANGEIIEQGNHTELIAKKGVYYENYMSGQYSNNL